MSVWKMFLALLLLCVASAVYGTIRIHMALRNHAVLRDTFWRESSTSASKEIPMLTI